MKQHTYISGWNVPLLLYNKSFKNAEWRQTYSFPSPGADEDVKCFLFFFFYSEEFHWDKWMSSEDSGQIYPAGP